jgi:hypothetical protein
MPPFSPFTSEYDGCMPCPDQLIRFFSVFPSLYQLLFADLTCLLPSNCDPPHAFTSLTVKKREVLIFGNAYKPTSDAPDGATW